jgi:oligopeptidase B
LKDTTTLRPYKIMKHVLGADVATDDDVFVETDEKFNASVYQSKSKKFLIIASDSTLSTEYRYLDASNPEGDFEVVQQRERDLEYHVEHFQDKFFIRTNYQAKNFRLMETPIAKPGIENWAEVIPHRGDVLLEDFVIFNNFLVVEERRSGLSQLRVIRWPDKSEYDLDFGEETYTASLGNNPEFESDTLRYQYSSLTTPDSTFDYNMKTKGKTLMKQQEVLGGFDPENYHAERISATAKDGVRVPISLVYRKGIEKNGVNPLLLYGYGSYGSSTDPSFSSVRLSLLDRGFIYAIAHIRGGQEMGREWYEDGKLFHKKNTFTDFIACAEHLIAEGYTQPAKLFAMGRSAGGLLMGAVVNMRPDLFRGVIAGVPWVDVITTMLDPSIPLTTSEYDEWGNPNNKDYYDYMLSYSPYDNVVAQDYPALFVTTGLHDSQVQYFEPAKWVAKLRALKTDSHPLLLHTNMEAGHGGASGRFRRYRETAMEYAFILDLVGIKN